MNEEPASRSQRQPEIDCLARIEARRPTLRGASRQVADSILSNPWGVLNLTIGELATRSGVSSPSVSRFCRVVGYDGYRELIQGLARALGRLDSRDLDPFPAADHAGTADIARQVIARQLQALRDTESVLDFAAIDHAVTALVQARRVTAVGSGNAYLPALGLALKLGWAGVPIVATTPDAFSIQLVALQPGDVALFVSHQGRTRDTVAAAAQARHFGATTIAISPVADSPLMTGADIALPIFTPPIARVGTFLTAQNAELVLADILAVAITERLGDRTRRQREAMADWLETHLRLEFATADAARRAPP